MSAVRHRFSYREPVRLICPEGEGRAKQSMRAECDINNIMLRFQKTGALTHFAKNAGSYGFASSATFHEAMNIVRKAEEMFDELPATLRRRFGNDPAMFLDFVQDEKNLDAMRELGLAKPLVKAVEVPPMRVEVVNPSADDPPPIG